jgi:hypothetical protein
MTNMIKLGMTVSMAAVAAAMLATGCARTPLRTEASTSGIRAAEEAGAAKVPQASLHLQLAKEELAGAKELSAKGEKEKAASLLTRAEVDAELAVTLSRGDAERLEARAAVARVQQLRQDNP